MSDIELKVFKLTDNLAAVILNESELSSSKEELLLTLLQITKYLYMDFVRGLDVDTLKNRLTELVDCTKGLTDITLKDVGSTCSESQRICIYNAANELQYAINGIEETDLKEKEVK